MVLRHLQTFLLTILLILVAGTCVTSDSGAANAEDAALGSWSPRGTRRVIYTSDLSNTTSQMSEPAKPQELRKTRAGVRFGGPTNALTILASSTSG